MTSSAFRGITDISSFQPAAALKSSTAKHQISISNSYFPQLLFNSPPATAAFQQLQPNQTDPKSLTQLASSSSPQKNNRIVLSSPGSGSHIARPPRHATAPHRRAQVSEDLGRGSSWTSPPSSPDHLDHVPAWCSHSPGHGGPATRCRPSSSTSCLSSCNQNQGTSCPQLSAGHAVVCLFLSVWLGNWQIN